MKKFNKLKLLGVAAFASIILTGCSGNSLSDKLQIIKDNYTTMILNDTNVDAYKDKSIEDIMKTIVVKYISGQETYYFNDIDYHSSEIRSQFPAGSHLSRAKQIAVLAKKNNDDRLMDIAIKLVNHWVLSNYRSINWWHNEIGCNGNLTDIGIILFDKLNSFVQEAFRGKVDESSFYHRPQLMTHEGSNLINYINMSLKNSVFDNNEKEYDLCNKKTNDILKVSKRECEGFMKDGSFHQHGTEMQTGSYGLEAVGNIGKILTATKGTNFNIDETSLATISKFVTEGISGISHKGKFNFMGINRAYSRVDGNIPDKCGGYKQLRYFEAYDKLPNKDLYKETLDNIDNGKSNFIGMKTFPDSNYVAVNVDGVYMAFMGANAKGRVTESTNGENCLGYNFAWGNNTCVMESGNEYYNISPVWNYSKLPGCTSVEFSSDQSIRTYTDKGIGNSQYSHRLPFTSPRDNSDCIYNFNIFNDEVTYSMCSSFKDVISKDGVVDEKSGNHFTITCFATNDGMCIVGSDFDIGETNLSKLDGLTKSNTLYTTVEQNIVNDGVTPKLSGDERIVTNGNAVYSCLDENDKLEFKVEEQKGTFQRNNPDLVEPKELQKEQIFTVTYKPTNNNNYAYSIQSQDRINNKRIFKLACNSNGIHAIEFKDKNDVDRIAACFYKETSDSFTYDGHTYTRKIPFVSATGAFELFTKEK